MESRCEMRGNINITTYIGSSMTTSSQGGMFSLSRQSGQTLYQSTSTFVLAAALVRRRLSFGVGSHSSRRLMRPASAPASSAVGSCVVGSCVVSGFGATDNTREGKRTRRFVLRQWSGDNSWTKTSSIKYANMSWNLKRLLFKCFHLLSPYALRCSSADKLTI